MRALLRFLTSVRLATVLILAIIALALLATLVPQNRPDAWYAALYPAAVAEAITFLHVTDLFRSALFLVPVCLFTINLGACTVDRLIRRARRGAARRHGPDLLHAGLLVLIAAGLLTSLGRQEATVRLAEGEEAALDESWRLRLISFQVLSYENGAPREWISTVRVIHDGREEPGERSVRVNHPLRAGGMRVYQSTADVAGVLGLTDAFGAAVDPPSTGDYFTWEGARWTLTGYERTGEPLGSAAGGGWRAVFRVQREGGQSDTRVFGVGDALGPFIVRDLTVEAVTGLKVVRDPGRLPFLVSLPLILAGLGLGFTQKRGGA